jgi:hypothetical protein
MRRMDDAMRSEIAGCLENLANQKEWYPELWQRCFDLVEANCDNELLAFVYDDLIHYSGLFHSTNIFGFRVKPDHHQVEGFRQEFRDIASALRFCMPLSEAKKKYGL